MTAYYDFFRYVKLYSPDGTTLEQTIEADNVTDSINSYTWKWCSLE